MDVVQVMDLNWIVTILFLSLAGCSSAAITEGHVDPDEVEAVMNAHKSEFKACYESSPERKVGLIETRFKVNSSGKVIQAEVQMSTLEDPVVESCLLEQIRGLSFPSPTGGSEAQLQYPFKYTVHK